ncbi:MAG TPA: glycoside hydrolase family 2 TIM barrel-domain containing protein [Candidatus Hydrogenedentes bacterium]|nr:glycoside hydrolase family 2 TIM barrel-domain containing protein [Candidatus Hydrogenedentota bacterium]HPG65569.1 glycoside hydrolase family 2 TIM barrel-domain containing protein [Candidatus Hydrogenedentota bacterium]
MEYRTSLVNALIVLAICLTCRAGYAASATPSPVTSLDGEWWLATDPGNVGQTETWWSSPRPDAKPTKVPWIIQDAFPGYHGVAWYWKDFVAPANPHPNGRTLLRFWQVDYKADVWLNDTPVGSHEGGESVFAFDVTAIVKPGETNRLAVRVLNPTHEPIDGIVLAETPHRNKALPYSSGSAWDQGGIWDSVELLIVPQVWIEDLFVRPDWKTGQIRIQATIRNAGPNALTPHVQFTVAPAASGETLAVGDLSPDAAMGDTLVEGTLAVFNPHLWNLDDPFLYRVTARIGTGQPSQGDPQLGIHEHSVRCGFRDFRLEDGYFRLNGKRIYLRCSHTGNCCPIGLEMPHDPDFLRRDLINQKMLRYNTIRFISGVPKRYQLDLADEIGLMVYPEAYAGWCLADSPHMAERYNESVLGMIRRDRNHPCITMWGLLNETPDGAVFRHAVSVLPEVRKLDDTRVVLLNSGNWQMQSGDTAGIRVWRPNDRDNPCVTFNGTDHVVKALGITWAPGQMAFHPGRVGEYAVARWTAPDDDTIDFSAVYKTIAEHATTSIHVLHNGEVLFESLINLEGQGPECHYTASLDVHAGDTIDSVCGWGNGDYGADTTALAITITSASGKAWNADQDFSIEQNPNGAWSYGLLAPAEKPDIASFVLFPFGKTEESVGCISNPGSVVWEDLLSDQHPYRRVPHTAGVIQELRTIDGHGKPLFISECGIGSAMDLLRTVRWYEQVGKTEVEDAQLYRSWRDQYMADWDRYRLAEVFDRPEDFFQQSIARMAGQRLLSVNAVRANPNCIGHSVTGTVDQGMTGEGVWTTFRELKPGATDALFDAWAPLRWCLFVEPMNIYRNTPVKLEAVLANEDVLAPGEYPVRLQVVGPDLARVFEKTIAITIADPNSKPEPPMVMPVFSEEVVIDGPPGAYRFLATFEERAAACGEEVRFFVDVAPDEMPKVDTEIVLMSHDTELATWLTDRGIKNRPYAPGEQTGREVILASGKPTADPAVVFEDLAQRMARGSTVIFLTTDTYAKDAESTGWLPLKTKGNVSGIARWLYHSDEWCKRHPIFEAMQAGGVMDYGYYRELIPDVVFMGIESATDPVAGGINASWGYQSGLTVAVYKLGEGEFILNSLLIRDNLGKVPQAERLLRNMLRFAGRNMAKPLADLPSDFDEQLKTVGY